MKAAIFSCKGIGDGLISLLLSNNLYLNYYKVDTFHGSLDQVQIFFPHLLIKKYPEEKNINNILKFYDQIFVSYDESSSFIMKLIKEGKEKFFNKIFVLNPCPSKKIGGQPYHKDALFDPKLNMVDNIFLFCKNILKLKKTSKKIDLKIDKKFIFKKFEKRVILHPTSAKKSKNWPIDKYIKLAQILKSKGYSPVFVIKENEKEEFKVVEEKKLILKSFDNLEDLTKFIYESSFMIGNDSGTGHLSSLLGLSTISIFRNHRSASLWSPGFSKNKVIFPNRFIPNISIYRLRDKHWKRFISFRKILKNFYEMTEKGQDVSSLL